MARILIIDDEKQQLMLRAAILQSQGYEVEVAMNGEEAITLCIKHQFDLVITDWLMPTMTGLDITRQIKSNYPTTSIIMLTGWGNLISEESAHTQGIDYLLSKPC